jgi:hypothetical protein
MEDEAKDGVLSPDPWPRRAEILAVGVLGAVVLDLAAGVAQGLLVSDASPTGGSIRHVLLSASYSVNLLTSGMVVAAVLLAVLDDVLTGEVANVRSATARIGLWTALLLAGLMVVAVGYGLYETVIDDPWPGQGLHLTAERWWFVLSRLAAGLVAIAAGWLALRALEDPAAAAVVAPADENGESESGMRSAGP